MYVPQKITTTVTLRPEYDNRALHSFSAWFNANETDLQAYFRALDPDIRGCDFFAFASCQHEIEQALDGEGR